MVNRRLATRKSISCSSQLKCSVSPISSSRGKRGFAQSWKSCSPPDIACAVFLAVDSRRLAHRYAPLARFTYFFWPNKSRYGHSDKQQSEAPLHRTKRFPFDRDVRVKERHSSWDSSFIISRALIASASQRSIRFTCGRGRRIPMGRS
jgi:hypothetical protein